MSIILLVTFHIKDIYMSLMVYSQAQFSLENTKNLKSGLSWLNKKFKIEYKNTVKNK
jgi:hypothetical protein